MPNPYAVFLRDPNFNVIGQIDDYSSLNLALRYNLLGQFALTAHKNSPAAALLKLGNGVIVTYNGTTIFSGPMRSYQRKGGQANTITVGGPDDLCWLADKLAYPVPNWPYSNAVLTTPEGKPLYYFRMNDAAGQPAGNLAGVINGTYNGIWRYQQPGALDDTDTSAYADGSTAYVSVPTSGFPTGVPPNGFTVEGWINISAYPVSTAVPFCLGSNAAGSESLYPQVNSSGQVNAANAQVGTPYSAALSLNIWHHVAAVWDGASVRCYLDGALTGSVAGSLNFNNFMGGGAYIGRFVTSGYSFAGGLDEVAFYATALSPTTIATHYNIGKNHFYAAYGDTEGLDYASTVISNYVTKNLTVNPFPGRSIPHFSVNKFGPQGSQVSDIGRFDPMIDSSGNGILQRVALAGGDLGLKVVQQGTSLSFQVYTPVDKSATVQFSQDIGNLLDYTYTVNAPTANHIIVGGGQSGNARVFVEVEDATSISTYGRIEQFIDRRDTTDTNVLNAAAQAALAQGKAVSNLAITPVDTPSIQYGRDYNLGDKVGIVVDGVLVSDVVREIQLTLDPQNGAVLKPAISSPNNGSYDPLLQIIQSTIRRVSDVAQQVRRLQVVQ